ncbi:MAG TPA: hypothetical protein VHJ78_00400 [Actinomycetota bacterium]|nr:hypothetical protein [Actinomycetota bacterium]
MRAPRRLAGLGLLALIFLLASVPGTAAAQEGKPRKIVIVSMPSVTWEDVAAGDAPNLRRLAKEWSIGDLSLRTVGPRTDQASALVTIGAGNRARAHGFQPDSEGDADTAPNAIPQPGGGAAIRGFSELRADNEDLGYRAVPGALGERLDRLGLRTGVAGNSDGGYILATATERRGMGIERRRFGALALADSEGSVDVAEIGDSLWTRDPETLNGVRADRAALVSAAAKVIGSTDVSVVELTDTYRESRVAHAWLRNLDVPEERLPEIRAAVRRDDDALAGILDLVDLERDTLIVLATEGPGAARPETLTLSLMAGVGAEKHGWLTSATTLRPGLVTIADVGPGILRLLDVQPPESMTGQALHADPGPEEGRLDHLLMLSSTATFHLNWVGRFFLIFVGLQVILYSVAWYRLRRDPEADLPWIRRLTLGFMSAPAATLIMAALNPHRWGQAGPMLVVLGVSIVLTAVALLGPWRRDPSGPAAFICAVNLALILGDLATGAHLQLSSLIGYSPIVAGRFYGVGNLTFAILATSSMLLAGQVGARYGRWGIRAAAAIAGITVIADGASAFGADFGGVLALIPSFGVLLAMLSGRRLSAGRILLLAGLATGAALLVGGLDALRPPDEQTHIGRFVARLLSNGPQAVLDVIIRKINANWTLLTQSALTLSVPVAIIFLVLMLRRPYGRLRSAIDTIPGLRIGLVAAIVANVLGFALNDSGIAIPAMGLAIMAPYCLATVLGMPGEPAADRAAEPAPAGPAPAPGPAAPAPGG